MATVQSSSTSPSTGDGSVTLFTWALTSANRDGAPIQSPEWADRTWQAAGTWGGATLTLQGSNDGTTWFTLSNAAGAAAVTLTADAGVSTVELPLYVRPNLTTAGTGATVTVTLLARRSNPMRT